jgi:hypothetical protein
MEKFAREKLNELGLMTIQNINQAVETLSGGQRQGVAVARAAAFGSKVVILDEPTAALGVKESRRVLELIRDVRSRGMPIILISHNMPHVFEVADRIHIHRLGPPAVRHRSEGLADRASDPLTPSCATASCDKDWMDPLDPRFASCATAPMRPRKREARLLPVARIPHRPPDARRDEQYRHDGEVREALKRLGVDLDVIADLEPDAALGNGGLGRLAACFMESMATVDVPAYGYGIRYEHGLFRQEMSDGWQVELPETWLATAIPGSSSAASAPTRSASAAMSSRRARGDGRARLSGSRRARDRVAYDTPIVGWRGKRVNTLRLWSAQPIDPILLDAFNAGDHIGALRKATRPKRSRVLYPADSTPAGQELRLRQEYFFSSASLQDILRRHMQQYGDTGARCPTRWRSSSTTRIRRSRRRTDAHPDRRARARFR